MKHRLFMRLHHFAIQHPLATLLIAGLIVAASLPGIFRLKLRTDGHALVPQDAAEIQYDLKVREQFDLRDPVVILIRTNEPNGAFDTVVLRYIQTLSKSVTESYKIPKQHLVSLETEHNHRVKPDSLDFRRFLEPIPQTHNELTTLYDDLRRIGIYTGTIVSDDGSASALFVGIPVGADRFEVFAEIRGIVEESRREADLPADVEIDVIGAPIAEALLGSHILADLGLPKALVGLAPMRTSEGWRAYIPDRLGLVPIAMGVMALVFAVAFRSLTAAALPLIEVGACLAVTFGVMGFLGSPVYLTIAVTPIILTAIGVADEVHVFTRFRQRLAAGGVDDPRASLMATMDEMAAPLIQTSVTAAVGFSSFCLSTLPAVRAFGAFTAFGILFCLIWSLSVIPASLSLLSVRRLGAPRSGAGQDERGSTPRGFFASVGGLATRRPRTVIAATVVAIAGAATGIPRIQVQDSWINGFAPGSRFREATAWFNEHFLGAHILLLHVKAPRIVHTGVVYGRDLDHHEVRIHREKIATPGAFEDSRRFKGHWIRLRQAEIDSEEKAPLTERARPHSARVNYWHARIDSVAIEGDTMVVSTQLQRGSPVIAFRPAEDEALLFEIETRPMTSPDTLHLIDELESFVASRSDLTVGGVLGTATYAKTTNYMAKALEHGSRVIPDDPDRIQWVWDQYQRIRGAERLGQLISEDYAESVVTAYLKDANFQDVDSLMREIRAFEAERLAPEGISVGFAGDVAVSQTLIGAIVQTQLRSLAASLGGILLVTTLLTRSLRWGLLSVIPCVVALVFNFAAMGVFGVPLGVATSMFAGMTLGIGVDYAIHTIARFRRAMEAAGDARLAVVEAMAEKGPAILIDALAVSLGFGILVFSEVPANARLGILLVTSLVGCLLATFLLLPALLTLYGRRPAA